MDLSNLLGGLAQTGGGIWSGLNSLSMGNQLANIADPFLQYRNQFGQQLAQSESGWGIGQNLLQQGGQQTLQYGNMLSNLAQSPSQILNDPVYQASADQGNQAVQRAFAANGMGVSGNMASALQTNAMTQAGNFYNQRLGQLSGLQNNAMAMGQQGFNQLSALSGLSQANPGAAALAISNANQQAGQGFNAAGQGLGQLLGGNTSSNIGSLVRNIGNLFGGSGMDLGSLGSMFGGSGLFGGSLSSGLGSVDTLGSMFGTGSFLPGFGSSGGALGGGFTGIFGDGGSSLLGGLSDFL